MNRSKDRHMVAHCSSCREDRGIHTLKKEAHRHNSRGSDGHRGSMSDVSSTFHQSDIPCSKGERLFRGRSKAFR
jgi:hypothetical protein